MWRSHCTADYPKLLLIRDQAPVTLEARQTFQQGALWTLPQWLLACKGRFATDPRDFVFAGLSLIKPELLTIDTRLHNTQVEPAKPNIAPRFERRRYYPRQLPPYGVTWDCRGSIDSSYDPAGKRVSLLPKGLWPKLQADYGTDKAEVLINTAACLLTHNQCRELLSMSARTSDLDYVWGLWSQGDISTDHDGLPSWVPSLGSWMVRTR